MPDYDIDRLSRLLGEGKSLTDIAAELDGPPSIADDDPDLRMSRERARLTSESAPPGTLPDEDPVEAGWKAGHAAGRPGSEQAFAAMTEKLFQAAQAGDPRVVHTGTVDEATRQRWQAERHQRDVRNRERRREVR
jgi:hypothetical protein